MFQTTNQIYVYIYILFWCFVDFLELIRFLRVQLLWSTRGYLNMCLSPTWILRGLPCPLPLAMPPKSDHLGAWDHRKKPPVSPENGDRLVFQAPSHPAGAGSGRQQLGSFRMVSQHHLPCRNRHPGPIHPTSKKNMGFSGVPLSPSMTAWLIMFCIKRYKLDTPMMVSCLEDGGP